MSYLNFKEIDNIGKKTRKFFVVNNYEEHLGYIQWKSSWRKYVYLTNQADYDSKCLIEIVEFLNKLMNERKL